MFWMHGGPFDWWWMLVGLLWMLVFWGGLALLIVWAVRWLSSPGRAGGGDTPLEIARRRYARGEISREEFEQIKRDLA